MKTETQKPKKRSLFKRILKILAIALAVPVVFFIIVIPVFISSDSGRKLILEKINNSVAGSTDFASLSMGWFSGIKLTNLSFDDLTGQTSVRVKQIQTKPHYTSLLAGNISLGKTILDEPKISIDLRKKPAKETVESPEKITASKEKSSSGGLPVSKIDLVINDGDFQVTDTKANTIHLAQINSAVDFKGLDETTNFKADMLVAEADSTSPIRAVGSINPAKISGDLSIEISDLQLSALAPLLDLANIEMDAQGLLSADIKTKFENSRLQNLTGTAIGKNIDVGGPALKGDRFKTSALNLDAGITQQQEFMNIDKFSLTTDWANLNAAGKFPANLKSIAQFIEPAANYDLNADVDVDLPDLANQMSNTLKLQPGTNLTSGKLAGNITRTTGAGKAQIEADFKITNLAGMVDGKQVAISAPIEAQAIVSSDKSNINFDKLQASSSFTQINCSGTTKLLNYDAKADLQKLQSEIGSFINFKGYKTAGLVAGTGKIAASDDKINIIGNSTIQNLKLTLPDGQTASEPSANLNMNLDIARKTSDITITNLICTGGFGKFSIIDGYLPAEKTSKQLLLPITADVDLAKIRQFALLSPAYPKKLQLSGQASSKLNVSIDRQTTKIFTDSTQIKDFAYGTTAANKVALGLVTAKLDLTAGPAKTSAVFDISNPNIKLKGNFNTDSSKTLNTMTAKADCEYDWTYVAQLLSAFMPQDLTLEGKNKTNLEFSSSYPADKPDQMLANLNVKPIKVAFDKAEYKGLTVTEPSNIEVKIDKGLLTIPQCSMKVNDGMFNFAATADFKQTPAILRTTGPQNILQNINIDERVSVKLLQYLNPIFKDADRVSGIANFSAQTLAIPLTGGTAKDFELDGTFSVKDMQLVSPFFRLIQQFRPSGTDYSRMQVLPTQITAKDGLVRYDNMQVNVGENPFNFVGRINLLDKSIEGSRVVTPYTASSTIKVGQENTQGRIIAYITGNYDNPSLDYGKTATDALIQFGIEQLLKK